SKNFKYALILFSCVLSHWILDLLVHYPDLPLYPGNSPKVGLGLWGLPFLENIIEFVLFIVGIVVYLGATSAKNKTGKYVTWCLIMLLAAAHCGNILGPKPTDTKAVGWAAQLMWLFVILAFWGDRNRAARVAATS